MQHTLDFSNFIEIYLNNSEISLNYNKFWNTYNSFQPSRKTFIVELQVARYLVKLKCLDVSTPRGLQRSKIVYEIT